MNNPAILAAIITVVFSAIGWLLKKSIVERIDILSGKVTEFKEEMLRDYVRRPEMEKNDESHEKIWINIKAVEKSLSRLEGRLNGNEDVKRTRA